MPLLTAPLIYSLVVPLVLVDVWMTVYQWVCFPIYGMARVAHRDHVVIDHHRLAYLNAIEKVHCVYCSYANGVVSYIREIAARTEQYWCPIKHAAPIDSPHGRYYRFADYGDAEGYRRTLPGLRRALRDGRLDDQSGVDDGPRGRSYEGLSPSRPTKRRFTHSTKTR